MDPDFWHSRWTAGQIGFHEGTPNAHLVAHVAVLGASRRVLVPLCGKSEDLVFLADHGHQVVGVELVESAVQAFFAEHGVTPLVSKEGSLTRYAAENITLLVGDFFATTPALLGPVDALYDRAALIALPAPMRSAYAKHVRALLPPGSPGLTITVEYPQELQSGPPFSVPEPELRAHYAGLGVERLFEVKATGARLSLIDAREKGFVVRF
jgi:thiopurine S-methyltransferase